MPFSITTAILIFFAILLVDICWTMYISESADLEALKAAWWSSLIMLFGAFTTVSYVENRWYVIPAVIGAFVGTYGTIWWKKKKALQKQTNEV